MTEFSHLTDDESDRGNPIESELSGASLVDQFCAEFSVNERTGIEMLAWCDARMKPPGIAESDAIQALEDKHRQSLHVLISFQSHQKLPKEIRMSTKAMALELGYTRAAGADNGATLAKLCKVSKQSVQYASNTFQRLMKLPPRNGQRGDESTKKMSAARNKQLTNHD